MLPPGPVQSVHLTSISAFSSIRSGISGTAISGANQTGQDPTTTNGGGGAIHLHEFPANNFITEFSSFANNRERWIVVSPVASTSNACAKGVGYERSDLALYGDSHGTSGHYRSPNSTGVRPKSNGANAGNDSADNVGQRSLRAVATVCVLYTTTVRQCGAMVVAAR